MTTPFPPVPGFYNSRYVQTISINQFGADPTGTNFSDTAMAAAIADLGARTGIISAQPGVYKFANSYTLGPGQGINTGQPNPAVVFKYTGNGVFLHSYDPAFNPASTNPLVSVCGPFKGFLIDGSLAGAAAKAFQVGDQNTPDINVGIQNFTSTGLYLCSLTGWVTNGNIVISTDNCGIHCLNDTVSAVGINGNVNYTHYFRQQPNQDVVKWINAMYNLGGTFNLYGSSLGAVSANTGNVMNIGPDNTVTTGLKEVICNIQAECDAGAGTVGPVTVNMGTGAYLRATGMLYFTQFGAAYAPSAGTNTRRFAFNGRISTPASDPTLGTLPDAGIGLVNQGGFLGSSFADTFAGGGQIFNGSGTYFATTLANGANTYVWQNFVAGRSQSITWHVTQPASGAAGTLVITGAKTPAGGGAVTLSAVNGETDVVTVWTPDGVNLFASATGLNYH